MIYIYRPKYSEGAEELAYALTEAGHRARFIRKEREFVPGDRLIFWGSEWPPATRLANVVALNLMPLKSKYSDALKLREAGVPTVEVSRQRPAVGPATRGVLRLAHDYAIRSANGAWEYDEEGVRTIQERIDEYLALPLLPPTLWFPRMNAHVGGNDLLRTPGQPDFWARKEPLIGEVRVHSFLGKSIRAGKKVIGGPNAANAHPWVRSYNGGWILAYEGFSATPEQRDLAAKAVQALGLDFGAVDLGIKDDGSLMVLEVNRAPGIEGGSVAAYVKAISKWAEGTR